MVDNTKDTATTEIFSQTDGLEIKNLRDVCRDVYHQNTAGLLSKEDSSFLENLFIQTSGTYKFFAPQEFSNHNNSGKNVERLQSIIGNLCNGNNSANQQIRDFMLRKGYIHENNGQIEFSPAFTLQTPSNNLSGGYTKTDKDGNILIVINQHAAERSDNSLAITIGHEICHQMINDKLQKNATSAEVEALCDLVGLTAAKGAGYDISGKIAENERDYSRETQKKAYLQYFPDQSIGVIEKMVDEHMEKTVNSLYMPEKLKQITEFIDTKIPTSKQENQQNQNRTASINKIAELRGTANTTSAAKQPPKTDHQKINQAFYQKMAEKQTGR